MQLRMCFAISLGQQKKKSRETNSKFMLSMNECYQSKMSKSAKLFVVPLVIDLSMSGNSEMKVKNVDIFSCIFTKTFFFLQLVSHVQIQLNGFECKCDLTFHLSLSCSFYLFLSRLRNFQYARARARVEM